MPSGRCKHDMLPGMCSICRPSPPRRVAPHLAATARLICKQCLVELKVENANQSTIAGKFMRIRREHSASAHDQPVTPYSSAEVVLDCNVCGANIGRLDVNTQTLGDEIMSYRSDHESAAHA